MARRLAALFLLLLASSAFADESYLGLFLQNQKIGYVATITSDETVGGKPLKRTDTKTVIDAGLLGQAMSLQIVSQTWNDAKGNPQLMKFAVESAGRTQKTEANFTPDFIHLVIENNGSTMTKKLSVPKDARVVDDAMTNLLEDGVPTGSSRQYYVLDPMTATLVKNTAKLVGKAKAKVRDQEFDATLIEISEPRATIKVFVSPKGDLIKAEAFAGITMLPLSKEEALADAPKGPPIDLAASTRLTTDKPLGNLDTLTSAQLKIKGVNLSRAPSDGHQTISGKDEVWTLDIHPVLADPKKSLTIAAAAKGQPAFLAPGLHIPAGSAEFKKLATTIVGGTTNVVDAAKKIGKYVNDQMEPNAGIGVLRNASEVLKTKEGVCRDYAILTATILRSAKIPARLASGLVYSGGAFYYHAWAEYWDGKRWIGLDSTRPSGKVTPGHIKLAHGSVEEAFLFTFLDKAQVQVLNLKRRPGESP